MSVFIEGMVLGLSLAFLFGFGPAFFALIQTGIYRGFWPGALLATGIILNDAVVVSLSLLGVAQIFGDTENYNLLGIVGGAILIVFGFVTYRKKAETEETNESEIANSPYPLSYIVKGFLLNVANPFVWLFWIGISVGILARFNGDTTHIILFFAGTLSVVFATDLGKTFLASQLKKFVTNKFLILINKIAGIALIGFGLYLIIRAIYFMMQ
jgi:threonine/homoserine/homoserine lactone efflux protein